MSFTPSPSHPARLSRPSLSRPTLVRLCLGAGALAAITVAEHILLPIGFARSAAGLVLAAPLWWAAMVIGGRRDASLIGAFFGGAGLAIATVAAVAVTDAVAASLIFLAGACVQILALDRRPNTGRTDASGPAAFNRTDALIRHSPESMNDLRLVR